MLIKYILKFLLTLTIFFINVYSIQGSRATQGRECDMDVRVRSEDSDDKDRFEEVKIAGFKEVSALESIPQSSGSQEEAVWVGCSYYKWNTERMRMIQPCEHRMGLICKGLNWWTGLNRWN